MFILPGYFYISDLFMLWLLIYMLILYICHPAGALGRGERNSSRGKKKLLCALLACCSKIVHGLLTHTDRALHKASCSTEGAVRDATGHCLFLLSLFPSSQSSQQLLSGFHLCLPACSHFSSDPSHTVSLFYTSMLSVTHAKVP